MIKILRARVKQIQDSWSVGSEDQEDPQVYGEYLGALDILNTLLRDVNRLDEERLKHQPGDETSHS